MAFYDTVTEMGYTVEKKPDIIYLTKQDNYIGHEPIAETYIVFYTKEKKITGFLKPLRVIQDLDDMCHLYHTLFLGMQKDLKFFADSSKYAII